MTVNQKEEPKTQVLKLQSKVVASLGWLYDRAMQGMGSVGSAQSLAEEYLASGGTLDDQIERLIRYQVAKSAASGFATGLGGLLTLPISIPMDLSFVWFIQIRMIAAIAHMTGHDLRDDRWRTMVFVCLCGNGAKEILKDVGIQAGRKLTEKAIEGMTRETVLKLNQRVGSGVLSRFAGRGAASVGKVVPVVGGIIGGTIDGFATKVVGNMARTAFLKKETDSR